MGFPQECERNDCDGQVFVTYKHKHPNGDVSRKRVCDKCKTTKWTIEVSKEKYIKMRKLLICLQNGLRDYMR
jgi:hypothetical protein